MIKKFAEAFKPLNENTQPVNEAKEPDMVIPANDAYDLDEEADNFKDMLKKAGVDAKCKAGIGEVEVFLKDKGDLKKAQKAIQKNGYMYEAKKEKGSDIWFSDVDYFKKEHKSYKLKPNDLISIHTPKGDQEMTYAEALKKFESADTVTESKGFASRELIKATEKLHAEQLKLQDLQNKFVTESDPKKKEKFKKDIIDQHKVVKQVERDFQTVLGREEEDIDDMFEASKFPNIAKQMDKGFFGYGGTDAPAGELAAIAESLLGLNNALAEDDIDDILTELEVAINSLAPNTPGKKALVKEVDTVLYNYTKLVDSINRAISGLVK